MTEIKKGTPVWVWDRNESYKEKATYMYYDDVSSGNDFRHIALVDNNTLAGWYIHAEPINEKEEAMKLIAEAKEKIAEAEKLLYAL